MSQSSIAEPYRSSPLTSASKHIRVLDIDPASTSTAPILGNLRVVDLTTYPNFTALSYVWSSSKPDKIITCNGKDIVVSANGHSALQNLRTSIGAFTIWIDAICIDQVNTMEKEHQIPLMGDIYSQAAAVYVWLSEGNKSSDRAIKYMKTTGFLHYFAGANENRIGHWRPFCAGASAAIARWSLTRHPFLFTGSPGTWRGPLGPKITRFWNKEANYATYEDIEYLLDQKWITRLWTYQEILLAAKPVIVCGQAHIPWDRFAMSLIFIDSTTTVPKPLIRPWKRVALSRQQLRAAEPSAPSTGDHHSLHDYAQFSCRLYRYHLGILMMVASPSTLYTLICIPIFFMSAVWIRRVDTSTIFYVFAAGLAASLVQSYRLCGKFMLMDRDKERPVLVDDLIDGTYTREATESKDMAFGLWAILQRRTRLDLPVIDYGESKEVIYIAFSRLVIQITGSPHLLLIAAMNNMKGQPSWVPDWTSKEKRNCDWGDIEELIRTNEGTDNLKYNRESPILLSMVGQLAVSLRGRRHDVVTATFVFRKTQTSYQQSEFRKHVCNLGQMLQLINVVNKDWPWLPKAVTPQQLRCWLRFLRRHSDQEVSALLFLLRDTPTHRYRTASAVASSALFETHVAICNTLAQSSVIPFQASNPRALNRVTTGRCRRSVKAGDLLVQCPGIQIPLIVRPCSEASNDVQIKSIAHTPYYLNEMGYQEEFRQLFSDVLRCDDSDWPQLEEFHVY